MGATPLTNYETTPNPKKAGFAYGSERDLYACPDGALLTRAKGSGEPLVHRTERRFVRSSKDELARERDLALCRTEEGRAALKRRKSVVEPPFGQMKRYGGLGRLSCRTTGRAQAKATLAAIGRNLKKLVKALGKDLGERPKAPWKRTILKIQGLARSQRRKTARNETPKVALA